MITTDYSETNNVAADHRDKVIEMVGRWWAEAGKYGVMPIDGSMLERMNVERPDHGRAAGQVRLGGSPVPFSAAPKVYNRAFSITADVQIPEGGAEGVLIATVAASAATPSSSRTASCISCTTSSAGTSSTASSPT